jgi:hypothetical protein
MTEDVRKAVVDAPSPEARRSVVGVIWRILAISGIVVATVFVAGYLRSPPAGRGDGPQPAARPAGKAVAPAPSSGEGLKKEGDAQPQAPVTDLRQMMAGILMGAADEKGQYHEPGNQDAESRRRFLAKQFGLPQDYPRGQVPSGLVPKGGKVLMVFESPEAQGAKMVLVRMPGDVQAALAEVARQYAADGWTTPNLSEPKGGRDGDRLIRFTREGCDRIVYARPRQKGPETLIAVYDAPH